MTEKESHYKNLEKMSINELLKNINREDRTIAEAVEKAIPKIAKLVEVIVEKMNAGGRLFYLGAGTSGRLGIVDASECPPTYGIEHGRIIALIAGGDAAIRKAVEFAEDNPDQGWKTLQSYSVSEDDFVIGIAASGTTPYIVGALKHCKRHKISTACITNNRNSPASKLTDHAIEVIVGPEFVTGSTRMKAGTSQKLVLNMISTTVMIKLGRVKDNKMVDMQLTNNKLISRGTEMLMHALKISAERANGLLEKHGSVRKALGEFKKPR